MRKVTQQVVSAFLAGKEARVGNTSTNGDVLSLHGNPIASKLNHGTRLDGELLITLAGWNTPTTRDRLNALPGVSVTTKKGQAYLNGQPWDGSWARVTLNK